MKKLLAYILIAALITNLLLFAFGLSNTLIFWLVILSVAVISWYFYRQR
jgi:hypothetical protein